MNRTTMVLAVLLGACPAADPTPAVDPVAAPRVPEPIVIQPEPGWAAGNETRIWVPRVVATPTGGTWTFDVHVVVDWNLSPESFNGVVADGIRSVLVYEERVALVADGERLSPQLPDDARGTIVAPLAEAQGQDVLHFTWPHAAPPRQLHVEVPEFDGRVISLWLLGNPYTEDQAYAVRVHPLRPDGRPVVAPGTVTTDEGALDDPGPFRPWVVPAEAHEATLAFDGFEPAQVHVDDDDAMVVRTYLTPTDPEGARAAAYRAALPSLDDLGRWRDLGVASAALGSVDAALDFVRDEIAVLPGNGARTSASGVLQQRAGTPVERVALARELLRRFDRDTAMVCGDLPAGAVEGLVRAPDLPAPPPALAPLVAAARAQAEGWAASSAEGEPPTFPPTAWATHALSTEWCGVRVADPDPAVPWHEDWLFPPGSDLEPPAPWRATQRVSDDVWRLSVAVEATSATKDGWDVRNLVARDVSAADLSDLGYLIDLFQDGRGRLHSQLFLVRDGDSAGRLGGDATVKGLTSLVLRIAMQDPDGVGTRERVVTLWDQAGGTPLARSYRLYVDAPAGQAHAARLARHLDASVPGAHIVPGAVALRARHDLVAYLRHQVAGGAVPREPLVLATVLEATPDGPRQRLEALPAPVAHGGDGRGDAVGRADAAARAVVQGLAPQAPNRWMAGPSELGPLRGHTPEMVLAIPRVLEHHVLGQDGTGSFWRRDAVTGGVGWWQASPAPYPPTGSTEGIPGDSPRGPHAMWADAARCALLGALQTDDGSWPEAMCGPAPQAAATPVTSPGR